MPSNETNPYRSDEALHAVFENGGPTLRAALLADFDKTRNDRYHDDVRTYVEDLAEAVGVKPSDVEDPYAPTAWGQPNERDFTCPSGQVCRVQRVDIMDLLSSGLLNQLDFLTAAISQQMPTEKGKPAAKAAVDGIRNMDPVELSKFRDVVSSVIVRTVVKPHLAPVPAPGVARVNGVVYVDTVPMTDQTAIFNWVVTGQEADQLSQFRDGSKERMGDVESGEVVQHETVELPGNSTVS